MAAGKNALPGLPEILRQARLRAGLTQDQVGAALGLACRDRRTLVSRLERGKIASPSLKFVLNYLRACGAGVDDIAQFLEKYLAAPLPVPAPAAERPKQRGPRVRPEDEETQKLRREAASWTLRQVLEYMLHHEINLMGAKPGHPIRRAAALFGRQVFRILYTTRLRARQAPAGPGTASPTPPPVPQAERTEREGTTGKCLARCRRTAEKRGLPHEAIEYLETKVQNLLQDMEKDGDLEWLPSKDEAQKMMARCARRRLTTDAMMCHHELTLAHKQEFDKLEEMRQPIVEGARRLIRAGVTLEEDIGKYMGFVTGFINVARSTRPGSGERLRKLEELIRLSTRRWHDPALIRRLADYVLQQWDNQQITTSR